MIVTKLSERIRPSAVSRIAACAASPGREVGCIDRASVYAANGSVAHTVAQDRFSLLWDRGSWLNRVVPYADERDPQTVWEVTVDNEMLDHIEDYYEYAMSLLPPGEEFEVEVKTPGFHFPQGGTIDLRYMKSWPWHIVDLKYGFMPVDAWNNWQLQSYALESIRTVPRCIGVGDPPPEYGQIHLHIYQPRAGGAKRWATSTTDLLRYFEPKLKDVLRATTDRAPKAQPGDHCTFCLAKLKCPELKKFVDATAKNREAPNGLTAAQLEDEYGDLSVIKDWCSTVEAEMHRRLFAGDARITKYKHVRGDGRRDWKEEPPKVEKTLRALDIPVDTFAPRELRSPRQLEIALGKKEFMRLELPLLVDKKPTAPTIAPSSDPRPALTPGTPIEDFPVLPDDDYDLLA